MWPPGQLLMLLEGKPTHTCKHTVHERHGAGARGDRAAECSSDHSSTPTVSVSIARSQDSPPGGVNTHATVWLLIGQCDGLGENPMAVAAWQQ